MHVLFVCFRDDGWIKACGVRVQMCMIVSVLVFEHAVICVFACKCEYICLWACKNCISTHYSMELHSPICLCVFVNMDVFTLLPGALCVGVFILKTSISCP